jgi:hypothetical protein
VDQRSVPALLDFLGRHWIDGRPREDEVRSLRFYGRSAGVRTLARQRGGVDYVVLLNQRKDRSGLSYNDIHVFMDAEIEGVVRWP